MDADWFSVKQAAAQLGLQPREARRLASSGALVAEQVHGRWFIEPASVRARRVRSPGRGRSLSPENAAQLLALLDAATAASGRVPDLHAMGRYRMRNLLSDKGPDQIGRSVAARARLVRHRAHPGVVERLRSDERVRLGGVEAAIAHGAGLTAGGRPRLYIADADLHDVQDEYGLRPDSSGALDIMVVPQGAAALLAPSARFVSPAVAWADLLDEIDPRAQHESQAWFANALVAAAPLVERRR